MKHNAMESLPEPVNGSKPYPVGQAPFIPPWLDDLKLEPSAFRVLCHVFRRAGRRGICWEAGPKMAKEMGLDEGTVWRALGRLVQAKLISRQERPGQTAIYRPIIPDASYQLPAKSKPVRPTRKKRTGAKSARVQNTNGTYPQNTNGTYPQKAGRKVLPGRYSQEGGKGSAPAGSSKPGAVANVAGFPPPPIFEPVPRKLFRREHEAMVRDAEAELKRVKADPLSRARVLSRSVQEMIDYLESNRREGWEARVQELRAKSENYKAGDWTPAAAAAIAAWKDRIQEIKAAMNGVVTEPRAVAV